MDFFSYAVLLFIAYQVHRIGKYVKVIIAIKLGMVPESREELVKRNIERLDEL
jgi:hypothetical protein